MIRTVVRYCVVLYLICVGTYAGHRLSQHRDSDRELDAMKTQAAYNLKILELRAGVHCDGS
jgi:hypothetical protein